MSWKLEKIQNTGDIVTQILPNQTKSMVCSLYQCPQKDLEYNEWRAGAWLYIKKSDRRMHIVRPLETLRTIAQKYDIPMQHLSQINQLKNNCVFIGQQLLLD